jgi:hypothetical protein
LGALSGLSGETETPISDAATIAPIAGAIPPAAGILGWMGRKAVDLGSVVGSGFGYQPAINRLERAGIQRLANGQSPRIQAALENPTEFVPGAKPTVAEAIAEGNQRSPDQFGGAIVKLQKELTGAQGVEDILPSVAKAQKQSLRTYAQALDEETKPLREAALAAANKGGVNSGSITGRIDTQLAQPGIGASDVVRKTLASVKDKIESLADESGVINANDLYTVRMEIGNTIKTFSKETANWDKRLTAKLDAGIKGYIDDAIESAGGKGWKDYLSTYSKGMQNIRNHEARLETAKDIAKSVKGRYAGGLVQGELPKPPTLLSRPMMMLNFALRAIERDANMPVVKQMAQTLQDPQEFSRLMMLPPENTQRRLAERIMTVAGSQGILGGQQQPQGILRQE